MIIVSYHQNKTPFVNFVFYFKWDSNPPSLFEYKRLYQGLTKNHLSLPKLPSISQNTCDNYLVKIGKLIYDGAKDESQLFLEGILTVSKDSIKSQRKKN